jgi:hypothetical protein
METILVILRELEFLESLIKLGKKKCDESLKFVNLAKAEGLMAVRRNRCGV